MEFAVGDKVKVNFEKVKENVCLDGFELEKTFSQLEIAVLSNENNIFTVSYISNLENYEYPVALDYGDSTITEFSPDELILVEKAES